MSGANGASVDRARAHIALGELHDALACARPLAAPGAPDAEVWNALGNELVKRGATGEARVAYEASTRSDPTFYKPHANLAKLEREASKLADAARSFARAVALAPSLPRLWSRLGMTRMELGEAPAAADAFERAAELLPSDENLECVARAALLAGRSERALELSRNGGGWAIEIEIEARIAMGRRALVDRDADRALDVFSAGLAKAPHSPQLARWSGVAAGVIGDVDRAMDLLERAAIALPDDPTIGSDLLFTELHALRWSRLERRARHEAWAAKHAPPAAPLRPVRRNGARPARLRVGFLSPDFGEGHAVLRFARAAILGLDRSRFDVFCYATRPRRSGLEARGVPVVDVTRGSDLEIAKRIAADELDVLVELAGHTAGARLGILAHRPAPLIASWLGYPATIGMTTVDVRLTDAIADPSPDAEQDHVERLVRIERCAWCYPFETLPPPVPRGGPVRFGSACRAMKVGDECLATWAEILERVDGSTLALKGRGFESRAAAARVGAVLDRYGVDRSRVSIEGWTDEQEGHFAWYRDVDVLLDSHPYAGTTTTCEALGSGVPVVTWAGDVHVGRVGASLLTAVGLGELVTTSRSDYIARAVELAADGARRRELRSTLRAICEASPLGDAGAHAEAFGGALESALAGTE